MRVTILKRIQRQRNTDRDDRARFERLREQSNDHARFHDICRESYIQSLIVMVPAWRQIISKSY